MPKTWRPVVVGCALALAVLLGHLGVLQSMLEAIMTQIVNGIVEIVMKVL